MLSFILWYLAATLTGLAAFPLAYCLLPGLADRGYALSRALGMLVWGYVFWIAVSLGLAANNSGGVALGFLALLGLSGWALWRMNRRQLRHWWDAQRRYVLAVELLFLAAFAGLALFRAASPEIIGTEKPMELAFINAILRSPTFPPYDPWLSGYAISYYHFGYILVAMLARLTGTPGPVAFNLGLALVFALSAVGAFGIVYNLLEAWARRERKAGPEDGNPEAAMVEGAAGKPRVQSIVYALLAPLLILIVSNLEGFLEILHARGLFWEKTAAGWQSRFWAWLDILNLVDPPSQPFSWEPRQFGSGDWWWWRASRVLQDYDLQGASREIIDEFPFFSFLLGDLHPHVLAMPFAFLVVGLALNLFLNGSGSRFGWKGTALDWNMSGKTFWLSAVALGGIAFLNTWDMPVYVALLSGAYVLRRVHENGWNWNRLKEFLGLGVSLGVAAALLYLPFYLSFSSQAGGFLPSLAFFTRGAHFWVMFGVLLIPMLVYLVALYVRIGRQEALVWGVLVTLAGFVLLALFSLLLALLVSNVGLLAGINPQASIAESAFLSMFGASSWPQLLRETVLRRLAAPGAALTLFALLSLSLGLLFALARKPATSVEAGDESFLFAEPGGAPLSLHSFILLLILAGGLLALAPEAFYLRDQFGWRMNTIFKFYFQAWLLWGLAAAFGAGLLLQQLRRGWGVAFRAVLLVVLGMGLVYPVLGIWDRAHGFAPTNGFTLDGSDYLKRWSPDEAAAIDWLQQAPFGFIVEAVHPNGGQYQEAALISEYSGLPTVLGWIGHELQWRGGSEEIGSRQSDVERLYATPEWKEAQQIIEQYDIRYIYIGPRERNFYRVNEAKFERFLQPVFQQGSVTIYQVP